YGLGSPNQNLPGFVVLTDGGEPVGAPRTYGAGLLPAAYQGTPFRPGPYPVPFLAPPPGFTPEIQKAKFDLIAKLNDQHRKERPGDAELTARIQSYEVAFRMQSAAPDVVELKSEPAAVQQAYGIDRPETGEFGRRCLLARRLLERGVRFVQLY